MIDRLPTLFSITLTPAQLGVIGCTHDDDEMGWWAQMGCRPCSCSTDFWAAKEEGGAELIVHALLDRNDLLLGYRVSGSTSSENGRKALCRTIALAMGHRDPKTMDGWDVRESVDA